jgi:hypothetical protein
MGPKEPMPIALTDCRVLKNSTVRLMVSSGVVVGTSPISRSSGRVPKAQTNLVPPASIPPTHGMSFSVRPRPEGSDHVPAGLTKGPRGADSQSAAPRLVSASGGHRPECRCSTQEFSHCVPHNNSNEGHSRPCGADAPVRAGPPGPPFPRSDGLQQQADVGVGCGPGVRPTLRP